MFEVNSISNILNIILSAFSIPDEPVTPLPPPLIVIGTQLRPGMTAQSIAARIISRQSDSGRQVGAVFSDGPNVEEAMELIRIEEILNSLLTESVVNIALPPGISVMTVGVGNNGAPVISQGFTTTIATGNGVLR